jgi:hypothetical protein
MAADTFRMKDRRDVASKGHLARRRLSEGEAK